MTEQDKLLNEVTTREYQYGWSTDLDMESLPPGLNEDTVRFISAKKEEPEWLLEWRLKAFRYWQTMQEPQWAHVSYPPVNFQDIIYYAAPKTKPQYESLDEVDPELLETFNKLGISLEEQKMLAGVAVDAVIDSVSVKTTFREKLAEVGIIFCSMSEAVKEHPELVKNTWARWFHTRITSMQRSILQFFGWLFCIHSKRRALSHGIKHLFPNQCHEYRSV